MPQVSTLIFCAFGFFVMFLVAAFAGYIISSPHYSPCLGSKWRDRLSAVSRISLWSFLFSFAACVALAYMAYILS